MDNADAALHGSGCKYTYGAHRVCVQSATPDDVMRTKGLGLPLGQTGQRGRRGEKVRRRAERKTRQQGGVEGMEGGGEGARPSRKAPSSEHRAPAEQACGGRKGESRARACIEGLQSPFWLAQFGSGFFTVLAEAVIAAGEGGEVRERGRTLDVVKAGGLFFTLFFPLCRAPVLVLVKPLQTIPSQTTTQNGQRYFQEEKARR